MWEERERSPALAAPGSNDLTGGLIASSTTKEVGAKDDELQALPENEANDLCERYRPLALKIAASYRGKGVELEDLQAAGVIGLVLASRKFNPDRGAFGSYAKHWIRGEIAALFKPRPDALASVKPKSAKSPEEYTGPATSISTPLGEDEEGNSFTLADTLIGESAPPVSIDASDLSERERRIVVARAEGETLAAIGKEEGVSAERVRQLHSQAQRKLNSGGNVALTCIRSLSSRRGYRPPSWAGHTSALETKRFERNKYKGRRLTAEEIAEVIAGRRDLLLPIRKKSPIEWYWWSRHETACFWWNEKDTRPRDDDWGWYWKKKSPGTASVLRRCGKGPWRKCVGTSEKMERKLLNLPAYADTELKSDPAWGAPQ